MKEYKDKHTGETCIIIGNGPSLKFVPNHFLDKYPTFGSNRVYLKYIPKYYVCVNPLVIEQNRDDIEILDSVKFIRGGMLKSGYQLKTSGGRTFSKTPDVWIYEGYTVTFVSMELAFYMGFSIVLLVGIDHRYKYDGKPNLANKMTHDDPNHFDPDYFKNQWWNNPDLEQSERSYRMAKLEYEKAGRKIINLTSDTALDIFEKGDIQEWIAT